MSFAFSSVSQTQNIPARPPARPPAASGERAGKRQADGGGLLWETKLLEQNTTFISSEMTIPLAKIYRNIHVKEAHG